MMLVSIGTYFYDYYQITVAQVTVKRKYIGNQALLYHKLVALFMR
jgi:hypothetical protein